MISQSECTGCGVCEYVCPVNAITLKANKQGFFYPDVDSTKCISCNLCEKKCHLIDKQSRQTENKKAYAAWSADMRREGSSGGIFGELAKHILNEGGVVFGAAFSDDYFSVECRSTDEVDLVKLQKSKYVESYLNGAISKIKIALEAGRYVLFCGTPCQVSALRRCFGDKEQNLYLVDFLCHGVPSQLAYQTYLRNLEKRYNSEISSVSFRSKKMGWKTYCMYVEFKNGKKYLRPAVVDPYYEFFLNSYDLRESCYKCSRIESSHADITLGDFWGIKKTSGIKDDDKGISLVLSNNGHGDNLLAKIKSNLECDELNPTDYQYIYSTERRNRKTEIDYFGFNFFDNPIIKTNSILLYMKAIVLSTKIGRLIVHKLR